MKEIAKEVYEVLHNLNWLMEPHNSFVELVEVNGKKVVIHCVGYCTDCRTDCVRMAFKERMPHIKLIIQEKERLMRKKSEKKSAEKTSARQKIAKKSLKRSGNTGINKQYLKSSPICRVTFRLPKDAAPEAHSVTLVGDFNNWNLTEAQMKKLKNGDFKFTLALPLNREYKFRYFIDGNRWENDWFADKYTHGPYGCDDSVVVV